MAKWTVGILAMQCLTASAFLTSAPRTTAALARRSFRTSSALGATQYLLHYDYIPDVLEKRGPYREGHLDLAKKLIAEGTCLSGGPTGEPGMEVPSGALFIFTDLEAAQLFVKEDPYTQNGIVTGHSIKEWNVVVQKE
ncbi:YCII-related domain [Seminavis robusta]|uniref:YCII-related domain n=1 Tax=Seminavis robusta TaxID=568900 RepID=A0A9N8DPU7_9STRA|nr:YCII-related domain [Seminavis robusta]|eukprot:Sro253_g099780.1 YCII-related domain (138) ;mRNA; r:17571-17984